VLRGVGKGEKNLTCGVLIIRERGGEDMGEWGGSEALTHGGGKRNAEREREIWESQVTDGSRILILEREGVGKKR